MSEWVLQDFFITLLAAVKFLHKDTNKVRLIGSGGADCNNFGQVSFNPKPERLIREMLSCQNQLDIA